MVSCRKESKRKKRNGKKSNRKRSYFFPTLNCYFFFLLPFFLLLSFQSTTGHTVSLFWIGPLPILHSKYHGFWWPVDGRTPGIRSHSIDVVLTECSSYRTRKLNQYVSRHENICLLYEAYPSTSDPIHIWFSNLAQWWTLDCLFNSLFSLATKIISKLHIIGPLWGESSSGWWTPV